MGDHVFLGEDVENFESVWMVMWRVMDNGLGIYMICGWGDVDFWRCEMVGNGCDGCLADLYVSWGFQRNGMGIIVWFIFCNFIAD